MTQPSITKDTRPSRPEASPVLELRNLRTAFPGRDAPVTVVNDVSLTLAHGESLAVVGESGSG